MSLKYPQGRPPAPANHQFPGIHQRRLQASSRIITPTTSAHPNYRRLSQGVAYLAVDVLRERAGHDEGEWSDADKTPGTSSHASEAAGGPRGDPGDPVPATPAPAAPAPAQHDITQDDTTPAAGRPRTRRGRKVAAKPQETNKSCFARRALCLVFRNRTAIQLPA